MVGLFARTIGAWKLGVSDSTEFFNNIDPKLTLECALISLAELIHDLECCSGSLWRCRPSQPPSIKVEENMLRAVYGKRIGLALAGILAGAVMGLAFADVAHAGRGGGGGFHGGGGGFHVGGGGGFHAGAGFHSAAGFRGGSFHTFHAAPSG